MKAQGLSVSFVVVAALAILILVLAVAFVMGFWGSSGKTFKRQQVIQTCNSYCDQMNGILKTKDCTTGMSSDNQTCAVYNTLSSTSAYKAYNNTAFRISGGGTVHCRDVAPCTLYDSTGNSFSVPKSAPSGCDTSSSGPTCS